MKKYIGFILLFFLPIFSYAQNGILYAEVDSNYVTLWHTGTQRICGASYEMEIFIDNSQIDWLQHNIGEMAYCVCNYDLSVTIGPLSDGQYAVNVSSIELTGPDTIYYGTIQFEIETAHVPDSTSIISQYSGPCYDVVSIDEQEQLKFEVRINAANTALYIHAPEIRQPVEIVIFDQTGKRVYIGNVSGISKTQIDISDFSAGIYLVTTRTKSGISSGKFIKY